MPWDEKDENYLAQKLLEYGEPQIVIEATGFYSRCRLCGQGFSKKDEKLRAYVSDTYRPTFCPTGECAEWVMTLVRQMREYR